MNVQSIDQTGLMIPIRVNDKFFSKTGMYELICGEGRLIAHRRLGRKEISAEIVTCTRRRALLESLIENIARTKPRTMDFARELKRMKDDGVDLAQIARICCRSEEYVRQYIRLVEKGEERLILGVERGIIPISFATLVASTEDSNVQGVLLDAFDQGIVSSRNFAQVRGIINARIDRRHDKNGRGNGNRRANSRSRA
jgi:ParB family chromosome partitioning protein